MLTPTELAPLLAVLRAGGVVACATETFFGLLADALDAQAVQRVCQLKGRAPEQPIAVLLPNLAALDQVSKLAAERRQYVERLAQRYWPGPLTLVVPALPSLPSALTKDGKVGVRVPGASPALQLVRAFGGPLTATSANQSGQPAARTWAEVQAAFPSGLGGCVSADAPGGLASSVIDVTGARPVVIRAGAIALRPDDL